MSRRLSASLTALLVIPCFAGMPQLAYAQVPPPPSGSAPAAPPAAAPAEMTEDQKLEKAKGLYSEAETAFAAGDYATAVTKYEEAYYLVPGKHGFAHKVGITAWKLGDCTKADQYLKHYVHYEDQREKNANKLDESTKILGEIAASGCAAAPEPTPTTSPATPVEDKDDGPDLTSNRDKRDKANQDAADENAKSKKGLLIGGAVLVSLGVIGAGAGAGLLVVAKGNADDLASASAATGSGFSQSEYSDFSDKDQGLKGLNAGGIAMLAVGGAMLIGGGVMIGLHVAKKKREGGSNARLQGVGPMVLNGGAGASASIRF